MRSRADIRTHGEKSRILEQSEIQQAYRFGRSGGAYSPRSRASSMLFFFILLLLLFVVLVARIPVLVRFGGSVVILIVIVGLLTECGARGKAPAIYLFPASAERNTQILFTIESIMGPVRARDGHIGAWQSECGANDESEASRPQTATAEVFGASNRSLQCGKEHTFTCMRIGVHSRQVSSLLGFAFGASRLRRHGVQVNRV